MRRTHATVMVALLAALLLAAGCKSGDDDDADELPTVEYKVLGGRLVWCSGGAEDLVVPGNASSIGNNAFNNCGHIKTLTIPATVTYIMSGTFSRVTIDTIYFGGTYDDWDAMVDGFGFTLGSTPVICADDRIWIWTAPAVPDVPVNPDDWQVVDGVVTAYTGTETTVTLPDGVTKIEAGAIPAGTTIIFHGSREQWEELAANSDLTGLTAFAVDDDGTLVGYHQGIETDIVIPDGVTAIGGGVFEGCTDITTVTIPKGVTDIGDGAFSGCAGLTDVTIPGGVTAIGDGAFSGCAGLTDVTIPASVTDIGADAFKDCAALTDMTIPGGVTNIGDGAFSGCAGLTDVTIPASVTDIGDGAFKDCTGLAGVTIPASVEHIGDDAFDGCTSLVDITYGGTMEQLKELTKDSGIDLSVVEVVISSWVIRNGVLISYCGSDTDITIPDSVTAIGDGAFAGNAALTGVEIPAGVTTIGADAFAGCTNLDTITFAGTVEEWRKRSEGSGLGDDVTVICSDGMWPPTVYVASTGSDDNPGSRSKPFATIQKAVDTVIARNDGATAYTIYVDGTLTQSVAASTNGMADFSALDKNLTLTIKVLSDTATLDANQKSRVINAAPASGKLNLTLDHLTVTGGNTTGNGGGIYFGSAGGTLTISDGTTIKGNTASAKGGGVYVCDNGTFTMTGGTISGNTATASGGGVYVTGDTSASGTFIMKDGTISGNTAGNDGGGVCVFNGTFTMEGGTIRENKADGSSELFGGGGIYLYRTTASMPGGRFTLKGGTVSGNEAEYGGGIWANASSECAMEGGSFSGNKATYGGGAYIYPGCTFKMSGSAQFADDNDMYLHTYTGATLPTVQIAGALTAASPVATIALPDSAYTTGTQVLSGAATTLAANCGKFEVSEAGWKIDGEGKLALSPDIYVSEGGDDTSGRGSQAKPFATLQKAFDLIQTLNLSTVSYTVHISGAVKGKSELSADVSAQKISITGTTGAKLDGNQALTTLLTVSCSAPVEVTNITLTNNRESAILVKSSANVTLGEGAAVFDNNFAMGGVDIASGGTFTMKSGATISENKNRTSGGGGGGGVRNKGTFIMEGGTISGNYVSLDKEHGGGVYSNGTFIMKGGEISGNYTSTSYSTGCGGGVYVAGGTFEMTGGTISGNTASSAGKGGGVYVSSGTFTMGGSASIPAGDDGKNDVYLASGKKITVASDLTAEIPPVATITLSAYTAERQVLSAGGSISEITQGICDKFAVTPQDDGTKWKIAPSGSNGVLEKDEVSTGGGISVIIPDLGTYTFYLVSGGSEVVEGSELSQSATITLREVRRDGVALTASDGTFLIEMQDTSGISFSSAGISDASATGLPATIKMPPLPPVPTPLQVYVKAVLTSGTVIDETISVTVEP